MESQGLIYYYTAPGIDFDPRLIELFRRAIQFKELDLPMAEGDIEQATLEGKYLVTRAGKYIWVTIIINQKPTRFTREALHSFSIKFESRYGRECKHFYTKFNGNVNIFKENSPTRESVDSIIEEVFHMNLTLPHKLGFPTGKKLSAKTKRIWNLAEDLAHKTKGYVLLGALFTEAKKELGYDNKDITDSIFNLVQAKYLLPISLEEFKRKFAK
ncbi:MAG: hypothetical protein ACP6IY_05660 [Promethearchaeia archaeon]